METKTSSKCTSPTCKNPNRGGACGWCSEMETKTKDPECTRCGLWKSTCDLGDSSGDEWVKNCCKVEGQKHDFEEEVRQETKDWEVEFDRLWYMHNQDKEDFLDLIRSLLATQKKEIEEKIEALKKDNVFVPYNKDFIGLVCKECHAQEDCKCAEYNRALDDALSLIQK